MHRSTLLLISPLEKASNDIFLFFANTAITLFLCTFSVYSTTRPRTPQHGYKLERALVRNGLIAFHSRNQINRFKKSSFSRHSFVHLKCCRFVFIVKCAMIFFMNLFFMTITFQRRVQWSLLIRRQCWKVYCDSAFNVCILSEFIRSLANKFTQLHAILSSESPCIRANNF